MPVDQNLAALNIPPNSSEEDAAVEIIARITSATHDENPRVSLRQIYTAISQSGSAALLDPLNTLPLLLPCRDGAAADLLTLLGECSNAKEDIIAAQEAIERLDNIFNTDPDEGEENEVHLSACSQLNRLVSFYRSAIPRLNLRTKTASETARPLLKDLETAIRSAGPLCSREEGRELITSVSNLASGLMDWAKGGTGVQQVEIDVIRNILKGLVDSAVTACAPCIQSSLAQRTFEMCFPRLTVRSSVGPEWESGEATISEALNAYSALELSLASPPPFPTMAYLMLLAHSKVEFANSDKAFRAMLPILLVSIQGNTVLDETLSFLLKTLHQRQNPASELSPEIAAPLCNLLPSLASAHPDSVVRHQAFRILSMLLSSSAPQLRLETLKELTSESVFPQMRVAAVGLVKEAVLDGLATPGANIFASPLFVQVLGPVLFRPNPPDLFTTHISLKDIEESSELPRLVECLALYYVIIQRDVRNRTGMRDTDSVLNIEKSILGPIRSTLARWMGDEAIMNRHTHALMSVVSLQTSVERVDEAIASLDRYRGQARS